MVVSASVMLKKQQFTHGHKGKESMKDALIWCNNAGSWTVGVKMCGISGRKFERKKWWESISGYCIGRKEWPVEKNKVEKQKEEILVSVEPKTQTNNKQMRVGWG